jgi:hypothetical protein
MSIALSSIRWPAVLNEEGPTQDPTIVLTGSAEIAGVPFTVKALRMRPNLRTPDYRPDLSETVYEASIDGMVDDIEDLVGTINLARIIINDNQYLLWVEPVRCD